VAYSKRFARLFKRSFGTDDIDGAVALLSTLKAGDALPEAAVAYLAKFGDYFVTLEEVHEQYEDRMKVALRNIEISSDELNAANAKLEELNLSINAMLESLGQGLFFFDAAGQCGAVYSKACETLLEGVPVGMDVAAFLKLDEKGREKFQALREIIFNPAPTAMSFEDLIALAPQWYAHSRGRKIQLSYRPMYKDAHRIQGVLVIASDVTQEIAVQEAIAAHEARAMRILRLVRERRSFRQFLDNLTGLMMILPKATAATLRHDLHTLKGQARFFYLSGAAHTLHSLENDLAAADNHAPLTAAQQAQAQHKMQEALDEAQRAAMEIWGQEFDSHGNTVSLTLDALKAFGDRLAGVPNSATVQEDFWRNILSVPLEDMLRSFESQVHYYAERENREMELHMNIDKDIRIFAPLYQHVMDALVHIARNLAVHAIEPLPIRRQRGKRDSLQVFLEVHTSADQKNLHMRIKDDGCGVDVDILRYRLKSRLTPEKIAQMSESEILNSIFEDDISTSDTVTETAGRGIGLGAVRQAVRNMGGDMTVSSILGKETVFDITLPILTRAAGDAV
jgi:signal transduction histidine kinase